MARCQPARPAARGAGHADHRASLSLLRCIPNAELFKAALCGLGALGIITGVVLQCAPLRSLRRTSESQSLDVVLEQLPEIGSAAEYVAFDWVPLADRVKITQWSVTSSQASRSIGGFSTEGRTGAAASIWSAALAWLSFLADVVFDQWGKEALLFFGIFVPALLPLAARVFAWTTTVIPRAMTDRADTALESLGGRPKCTETSWAIPMEKLRDAISMLREMFASHPTEAASMLPVGIRFVRHDDVWLSPAYGRDTAIITLPMFRPLGASPNRPILKSSTADAMILLGVRPMWGGEVHIPATRLRMLFPKWDHFAEMLAMLDPESMFVNRWLRRVLVEDGALVACESGELASGPSKTGPQPGVAAAASGVPSRRDSSPGARSPSRVTLPGSVSSVSPGPSSRLTADGEDPAESAQTPGQGHRPEPANVTWQEGTAPPREGPVRRR